MTRSLFALRRGAPIILSLALAFGLAACAEGDTDASPGGNGGDSSAAASAGADGGGTVAVENGAVDISADDLAFDANVIQATAGEAFTVTFTNNEAVPHNFSVYTEEGGDEIVVGEVITGPDATTTVDVPELEPGEYYFVCDVHPEMNGVIVVEG